MGDTKRKSDLEIPLYFRTSDSKALKGCQLQWFLAYYYGSEIPDATYFLFGNSIHTTIEAAVTQELTLDEALFYVEAEIMTGFKEGGKNGWISTSRRPEDPAVLVEEAQRGVTNWFTEVHPTSDDQHFSYSAYEWPPVVEHIVTVEAGTAGITYPIRSEIDAVFFSKAGPAVVDWKSGATAKADPIQLWMYHWELKNDQTIDWYPEDTRFTGWFHHTNAGKYGGKIQDVDPYPGDQAIEHNIRWVEEQKLLAQRAPGAAFPPSPDWWCNTCRVKDKCPVFGASLDLEKLIESVDWLTEPHAEDE